MSGGVLLPLSLSATPAPVGVAVATSLASASIVPGALIKAAAVLPGGGAVPAASASGPVQRCPPS
jgi:hypothetical protein